MFTLYGQLNSGNCYKVRLMLHYTGRTYRYVETNSFAGETRTPEFLAKNPNGKVPLLELENGEFLPESNAILWYLGRGTEYVPDDTLEQARVLEWMFFEQYSHEPTIAVARAMMLRGEAEERAAVLAEKQAGGRKALAVMDQHLAVREFFAADRFTIADVALYAYTHKAHEGGFDLEPYANVRTWLARCAGQAGHFEIETPEG